MNKTIKITLFVVFAVATLLTGSLFFSAYRQADTPAPDPDTSALLDTGSAEVVDTAPVDTSTNAVATTNAPTAATNTIAVVDTNTPPAIATNEAAPPPVAAPTDTAASTKAKTTAGKGWGRVMAYLGMFVASAVGLGLMVAFELSSFIGQRSVEFLYNDEGKGPKTPEYEVAEQEWANGNFLEAIQMLRDYHNKHPREVHAQVRIAEIYEKDLNNFLAAALEYEEILKYKLPPERWGWYAIHLCNLYFKLDKQTPAIALLQRLNNEHPQTQAAAKARKRLDDMGVAYEQPESEEETAETVEPDAPADDPTKPKLPPGFRRKK